MVERSGGEAIIRWDDGPGPFNVYRGTLETGSAWAYNQQCLAAGVSSPATDSGISDPGALSFYLVTRRPVCGESSPGRDSSGRPIPNLHPCPGPALWP
jgi:hypothetical protein